MPCWGDCGTSPERFAASQGHRLSGGRRRLENCVCRIGIKQCGKFFLSRQTFDAGFQGTGFGSIGTDPAGKQAYRPAGPSVSGASRRKAVVLGKPALRIGGHTAVQRTVSALQQIYAPGGRCGHQRSERNSITLAGGRFRHTRVIPTQVRPALERQFSRFQL